jgi:hypothetical protein
MKKRSLKIVAAMVSTCFLASGCASIVSGGPQAIPINSTPSAAKLEITDIKTGQCILSTMTPYTATLKRGSGYFSKSCYKIRVSKEGYDPQEITLEAGINGWYYGNILFGGLIGMLIVDPATGAMWDLPEDSIKISLFQDPTLHQPLAPATLSPVSMPTPPIKTKKMNEIINVE